MVDPISSQAVSIAGNGAAMPKSPTELGAANPKDVAQFTEAMQPPTPPMPDQVPGVEPKTLVDNLDKMSADMRAMQSDLQNAVSNMGEMGDLLRTQFQMASLTMTQTMVGQVGQKTSQGTQQLLKGQ